jgi:hypothetical protein
MCEVPPRDCGADRVTAHPRPPFVEARAIQWGNGCDFVLRTAAGWWQPRSAWDTSSFLNNGERYISQIDDITSTADGVLVVRGSFIHWTCGEKMAWLKHPRAEEWYECEQRVIVCAIGASGAPSCTAPIPTAYTTYCRDAEPPYSELHSPLAGVDFKSTVHVTGNEIRLSSAWRPVDGPLPGWYVIAADAQQRRNERRALPPPHLRLHFP